MQHLRLPTQFEDADAPRLSVLATRTEGTGSGPATFIGCAGTGSDTLTFTAMKLLSLSAVPIVLCMCVALSAQPQNDPVPQDKGAITGTVVDAISEQPLRG